MSRKPAKSPSKVAAVRDASTEPSKDSAAEKTWFVYILRCADGTLYTGITNDLEKRVARHNAGTGARYTRARLPVELVWHQTMPNKSDALKREYAIKTLSRTQKVALIETADN